MTEKVKELASTLREALMQVGASVNEALDVIMDHEKRLAAVEDGPLLGDLDSLEEAIRQIKDPKKRKEAYSMYVNLCSFIGVDRSPPTPSA